MIFRGNVRAENGEGGLEDDALESLVSLSTFACELWSSGAGRDHLSAELNAIMWWAHDVWSALRGVRRTSAAHGLKAKLLVDE